MCNFKFLKEINMDQKIKDLLGDARLFCYDDGTVSLIGENYVGQKEIEKFAELLIKECVAQVEKNFAGAVGTYAGVHNSAVLKCKKSILEHFNLK